MYNGRKIEINRFESNNRENECPEMCNCNAMQPILPTFVSALSFHFKPPVSRYNTYTKSTFHACILDDLWECIRCCICMYFWKSKTFKQGLCLISKYNTYLLVKVWDPQYFSEPHIYVNCYWFLHRLQCYGQDLQHCISKYFIDISLHIWSDT